MGELVLNVGGMGCSGCVDAVTRAVEKAAPGAAVTVDLASGRVTVRTDASRETIAGAIARAGYDIKD
ncbi:MAG TPA: heavy-metal-associated domain-containing protein [Beijerinckiaceae bacterium]|nr:heavy-metal-associated domain-containing protein [Beijerinckiaceae bacterium]